MAFKWEVALMTTISFLVVLLCVSAAANDPHQNTRVIRSGRYKQDEIEKPANKRAFGGDSHHLGEADNKMSKFQDWSTRFGRINRGFDSGDSHGLGNWQARPAYADKFQNWRAFFQRSGKRSRDLSATPCEEWESVDECLQKNRAWLESFMKQP